MEKLTPFIMCTIFVIAAFFLWKLAVKLSSYAARRKILAQNNAASKEATSVILISHFGEFAVRPNVCLPIRTGKTFMYGKIDNIVILPTCIAVVQVESMRGQIFGNMGKHIWHQSVRMPDGERKEKDFENPISNNERNIVALSKILEHEKITPPPIYNIIIFSSDKVVFSEECPEVYSLTAAINKMKALAKRNAKNAKITFSERRRLIRAIKKYSVPVNKAKAHNAKVLRASVTKEKI
jgi:hypothetical protein